MKSPIKVTYFGLIEVVRHDVLNKIFRLVYHESPPMGLPSHNRMVTISGHIIKHIMEFPRKRCCNPAFGDRFIMIVAFHPGIGMIL